MRTRDAAHVGNQIGSGSSMLRRSMRKGSKSFCQIYTIRARLTGMTTEDPTPIGPTTLDERVRRLEDLEAIRTLKARYCAACDDAYDAEAIASLFTENGVWDGEPTFDRLEGREAIRDYFSGVAARMPVARHQVMNPDIEVAPDGMTAEGRWLLFQPCTSAERGDLWLAATYHDDYRKVDGAWRIAESRVEVAFFVSYRDGWTGGHAA